MNAVARFYPRKCLSNPTSQKVFAGVRGRVIDALAAQPSSISLSDAMKQVERFRVARKMKS
jgi:hypothetical protein